MRSTCKTFTDRESKREPCRSSDGVCLLVMRTRSAHHQGFPHSYVFIFQRLVSAVPMLPAPLIRSTGPIPSALGRLPSLEILGLGDNKLTGERDLSLIEFPLAAIFSGAVCGLQPF